MERAGSGYLQNKDIFIYIKSLRRPSPYFVAVRHNAIRTPKAGVGTATTSSQPDWQVYLATAALVTVRLSLAHILHLLAKAGHKPLF